MKIQRIDDEMLKKYNAKPSFTNGWVSVGDEIWVCSYAAMPEDKRKKPDLFMVHYHETLDIHLIYRWIGN